MKSLKSELSRELRSKVDKKLNNKGLHNPTQLQRVWRALFNIELFSIGRAVFWLQKNKKCCGIWSI